MFSLFEIAFYVVALCIIVFSVLAVTTNSILRSATYLLFVLLATGGILTRSSGTMKYKIGRGKMISVLLTTLVGMALVMFIIATNGFALNIIPQGVELPVKNIGEALIGTGKYQFVLPFEVMSVLLLACMIGAIMIARKRK